MPLGTELNLSPGDVVLDGVAAPRPLKGAQPPVFGPFVLWPNGWIDEDAIWYGSRSQPRPHLLDGNPAPPPTKGAQQPPSFWPMSIVATVAHLSYC